MEDFAIGLASNISAHKAFIAATIEAEHRLSKDFEVDDQIIKQAFSHLPFQVVNNHSGWKFFPYKKKRGRGRRKKNIFKHNMDIKAVTLDYDDLCGRVASLQKRVVIGRWMFPDGSEVDTGAWIKQYWNPIIGYTPKISMLLNGWFIIHFMNEKYVYNIINTMWVWGQSFMQLVPRYLVLTR